jgi:hypothetical protein
VPFVEAPRCLSKLVRVEGIHRRGQCLNDIVTNGYNTRCLSARSVQEEPKLPQNPSSEGISTQPKVMIYQTGRLGIEL